VALIELFAAHPNSLEAGLKEPGARAPHFSGGRCSSRRQTRLTLPQCNRGNN
jgi:hypothetical protein